MNPLDLSRVWLRSGWTDYVDISHRTRLFRTQTVREVVGEAHAVTANLTALCGAQLALVQGHHFLDWTEPRCDSCVELAELAAADAAHLLQDSWNES